MGHIYRRDPIEKSYKVLNDNKFLILASDQDAKDRGVIVNFFGHKTSVPKGAAIFILKVPHLFFQLERLQRMVK